MITKTLSVHILPKIDLSRARAKWRGHGETGSALCQDWHPFCWSSSKAFLTGIISSLEIKYFTKLLEQPGRASAVNQALYDALKLECRAHFRCIPKKALWGVFQKVWNQLFSYVDPVLPWSSARSPTIQAPFKSTQNRKSGTEIKSEHHFGSILL